MGRRAFDQALATPGKGMSLSTIVYPENVKKIPGQGKKYF